MTPEIIFLIINKNFFKSLLFSIPITNHLLIDLFLKNFTICLEPATLCAPSKNTGIFFIYPFSSLPGQIVFFKPLFIERGVKSEDFDQVFAVSGFRKISKIDEAIKKAGDTVKSLRISGVPALIVNGKYKVGVRDAGSFENMIKITNFLVNKERQLAKK